MSSFTRSLSYEEFCIFSKSHKLFRLKENNLRILLIIFKEFIALKFTLEIICNYNNFEKIKTNYVTQSVRAGPKRT